MHNNNGDIRINKRLNTLSVVLKLGSDIKVDSCVKSDIVDCYVIEPKRANAGSKVIVRFSSKNVKNVWMKNKSNLKSEEFKNKYKGAKVFINDNLTWYYRNLFWKTKSKCSSYKFVWIKEGKIFVKKDINSKAVRILSEKTLESFQDIYT